MILHDTNVLSTFAKINRLDLLFAIFNQKILHLSANTESELQNGVRYGYTRLHRVLNLVTSPQPDMVFKVVHAGAKEQQLYRHIPFYPQNPRRYQKGEMDSIALAWTHNATIVCNERKVFNFCRNNPYKIVPCLQLEDLLRSLWVQGIMKQSEVQTLVTEIETTDRISVRRDQVF